MRPKEKEKDLRQKEVLILLTVEIRLTILLDNQKGIQMKKRKKRKMMRKKTTKNDEKAREKKRERKKRKKRKRKRNR